MDIILRAKHVLTFYPMLSPRDAKAAHSSHERHRPEIVHLELGGEEHTPQPPITAILQEEHVQGSGFRFLTLEEHASYSVPTNKFQRNANLQALLCCSTYGTI
jgi:hypothetical protein